MVFRDENANFRVLRGVSNHTLWSSHVPWLPGRVQPFEHRGVFGTSHMFARADCFTMAEHHKVQIEQIEQIEPTSKTKTKAPRHIETYTITCTG